MKNDSKYIYLDHAAITPARPEVIERMNQVSREAWGNPSSSHAVGRLAKKALDQARSVVAKQLFGSQDSEVVFTSGGTESNMLAIFGAMSEQVEGAHIISQPTEHVSVLRAIQELERRGASVTWLPVDQFGQVSVDDVRLAMRPTTRLISLMLANNEIGTIQPIQALVTATKAIQPTVLFHTDACQAAGILDLQQLGPVDLISVAGTKFGGPHAGALFVRQGVSLTLQTFGGGQERGRRHGTEAVPEIAGLAQAVELAVEEREDRSAQVVVWRDQMIHQLLQISGSHLNGHPTNRLPQNVHISFDKISGESLLVALDQAGIAASTGSACAAGSQAESHVLKAIGLPKTHIHGSLRLTLGWSTTEQEIQQVLKLVPQVINSLRK